MKDRSVLVTGAAGFFGSHLAVELALAGARVIALVRDRAGTTARERLEALEEYFAPRLEAAGRTSWPLPNLTVVAGDVEQPALGLGEAGVRRLLGDVDEILHCAARVEFGASRRQALMTTNRLALENFLPWLGPRGPVFNLVSTAYVAPDDPSSPAREQPISPHRLVSRDFRNPYEESKAAAEWRILEALAVDGSPCRILRPGILLGDSVHGRTTSFNALYILLELLDLLNRQLQAAGEATPERPVKLHIECDPSAGLGLVPVDWAARATVGLLFDRRTVNQVFHLTQPRPLTNRELGPVLSRLFPCLELRAVTAEDFRRQPADRREALVARGLRTYRPYLDAHPRFDDRHLRQALQTGSESLRTPCPPVTFDWLETLVTWGRQKDWGRTAVHPEPRESPRRAACRKLFESHLASRRGKALLPGTRRVSLTFDVVVVDLPAFRRRLEIQEGKLVRLEPTGDDAPAAPCRYELASGVLLAIARGELDPREAFFARQAEIRGDLETGMRMASLMVDFFRLYPLPPESPPGGGPPKLPVPREDPLR